MRALLDRKVLARENEDGFEVFEQPFRLLTFVSQGVQALHHGSLFRNFLLRFPDMAARHLERTFLVSVGDHAPAVAGSPIPVERRIRSATAILSAAIIPDFVDDLCDALSSDVFIAMPLDSET